MPVRTADTKTHWTDEQDGWLREQWEQGLSSRAIGALIGLTKNAILGRAHRLQLPPRATPSRKAPPERKRQPRAVVNPTNTLGLPSEPIRVPRCTPKVSPPNKSGCQWHLGREGLVHRFCGGPIAPQGGSWCAEHRLICFVPFKAAGDAA